MDARRLHGGRGYRYRTGGRTPEDLTRPHGTGEVTRVKRLAWFLALLAASACTPTRPTDPPGGTLKVVTTVSPITDIVRNIAGDAAHVEGLVPEGVDSHTFEPTPSSVRVIADADVIVINGLHLEDPTLDLARANAKKGSRTVLLGDRVLDEEDYVYDFSFPKSGGKPNPHLWMDVALSIRYAEVMRDVLVEADPPDAAAYRANAAAYIARLEQLDEAIAAAVLTVPASNRALLTYHDSFAYFAKHYGLRVIGAIQPSDFSEPSAREVADLIEQIKRQKVPAIFGSEVFPSRVLDQIAREAKIAFVPTLSDDDLPGEPGAPEHSYIGMMVANVRTMVTALGGTADALNGISTVTAYD